jgi:hypothetical protein
MIYYTKCMVFGHVIFVLIMSENMAVEARRGVLY